MIEKSMFLLRVGLGWVLLYAGIAKLTNPGWTAAGFLKGAKTFHSLYQFFALPQNIGWVNFLNEWGLTLLGIGLIVGVLVRLSSILGILLMFLYYFAQLSFPNVGNSFIIDDHIIYVLILLVFLFSKNISEPSLSAWFKKLPFVKNSFLKFL